MNCFWQTLSLVSIRVSRLGLPLLLRLRLVGLALWLVSGTALNKDRCECGTLNSLFALFFCVFCRLCCRCNSWYCSAGRASCGCRNGTLHMPTKWRRRSFVNSCQLSWLGNQKCQASLSGKTWRLFTKGVLLMLN